MIRVVFLCLWLGRRVSFGLQRLAIVLRLHHLAIVLGTCHCVSQQASLQVRLQLLAESWEQRESGRSRIESRTTLWLWCEELYCLFVCLWEVPLHLQTLHGIAAHWAGVHTCSWLMWPSDVAIVQFIVVLPRRGSDLTSSKVWWLIGVIPASSNCGLSLLWQLSTPSFVELVCGVL